MPLIIVSDRPVPLTRGVHVVVKKSEECFNEPLLAKLSLHDGPAAATIQESVATILRGEEGQLVSILVEDETDTPLAVGSVYLDGRPRLQPFPGVYTNEIADNPYVHVLARDDRYPKRTLLDGTTSLGSAALLGTRETIVRERPNNPVVYAYVDHGNKHGKEPFERFGFTERDPKRPDGSKPENALLVLDAEEPLPPVPRGYEPVLDSRRASAAAA